MKAPAAGEAMLPASQPEEPPAPSEVGVAASGEGTASGSAAPGEPV
jgi:hypothetical protein